MEASPLYNQTNADIAALNTAALEVAGETSGRVGAFDQRPMSDPAHGLHADNSHFLDCYYEALFAAMRAGGLLHPD